MKPFKFKLETSLELQGHKEKAQQRDLMEKRQEQEKAETVLTAYAQQMQQLMDDMRQHQQDQVKLAQIVLEQQYLPVLAKRIDNQRGVVQQCQQAVDESQHQLIEIMQGRKVLEKIKVKHYQLYQQAAAREEQKIIDEMATNAYIRNTHHRPQEVN